MNAKAYIMITKNNFITFTDSIVSNRSCYEHVCKYLDLKSSGKITSFVLMGRTPTWLFDLNYCHTKKHHFLEGSNICVNLKISTPHDVGQIGLFWCRLCSTLVVIYKATDKCCFDGEVHQSANMWSISYSRLQNANIFFINSIFM